MMKSFSKSILIILILSSGLFTSCATYNRYGFSNARQKQYEEGRKEILRAYFKMMFTPECRTPDKNGLNYSCPKMFFWDYEKEQGVAINNCKSKNQDCKREIGSLVEKNSARIVLRYKFADWETINLECKAYPEKCKRFMDYEFMILKSHNSRVELLMSKAVNDYDLAYANELTDKIAKRKLEDKLDEIKNSIQRSQNTSCTGTVSGGFINATCY